MGDLSPDKTKHHDSTTVITRIFRVSRKIAHPKRVAECNAGCILSFARGPYVKGNPVSFTDPSGKIFVNLGAAGLGAVIGGTAGGITAYMQGASGRDIAIATALGAGAGALSGFTFGTAGTLVASIWPSPSDWLIQIQ